MAKTKPRVITPRGELVKYAREVGLASVEHHELMRVIDDAQEADNPREFIDAFAAERRNAVRGVPTVESAVQAATDQQEFADAKAAVDRIREVLDGAPTDIAVGIDTTVAILDVPLATLEESPPCETFAPVKVDDVTFFLKLPNIATVECQGHQTRHVPLQLTAYPLARAALTRLRHHLEAQQATLVPSPRSQQQRRVKDASTALVWLLEQYGRAAGLE